MAQRRYRLPRLAGIALLSTATVIGTAMVAPGVAVAQSGDAVSCALQGTTTSLHDDTTGAGIPPADNVFPPAPTGSTTPGTAPFTTADHGEYAFTGGALGSSAACTAVYHGTTYSAATAGSITSVGQYYSISCGTGTAYSTQTTVTGTSADGQTASVGVAYTIVFSAGAGTLDATVTFPDGTQIHAAGNVDIVPQPNTGCSLAQATGFTVRGTVSGAAA